MAYDSGMMRLNVVQLGQLTGARAEKIYQPTKNELIMTLHGSGSPVRLLISASPQAARMHLTEDNPENPAVPPMFCMFLRKHFGNGVLEQAEQVGFDRVCRLRFRCRDELGDTVIRVLVCELMGRGANVLVTDGEDKILASMKPLDFSEASKRPLALGMRWQAPPLPENRRLPLALNEADFSEAMVSVNGAKNPEERLINAFFGISPVVARQIVCDAAGGNLYTAFHAAMETLARGDGLTLACDAQGKPVAFSYLPLTQYLPDGSLTSFTSPAELCDAFFLLRARAERVAQRGKDILKAVTSRSEKLTRKIALQQAELEECADRDRWRIWGDLLIANAYRIKRGERAVEVENYFEEGSPTVIVPLDERLTPQINAQRCYKKYKKLKTAESILNQQLELAHAELAYLATLREALGKAETENELQEIRDELFPSPADGRKKPKIKLSSPMRFVRGGFEILCGKNNRQNDTLTFKMSDKTDIWCHVRSHPGSHVLIRAGGRQVPNDVLAFACEVAAYYSAARDGAQTAVDYTAACRVKKPSGAKPGFVNYFDFKTAFVTPSESQILQARQS